MAEPGIRVDPYRTFRFLVEIAGLNCGMFRECTGFSSEITVTENPEGGSPVIAKLPGRVKYPNIVLKFGVTDSRVLYEWHQRAIAGNIERRHGSIRLLDSTYDKNRGLVWNFFQGWPCKWVGPDCNAADDQMAIETLEIAHERIEQG